MRRLLKWACLALVPLAVPFAFFAGTAAITHYPLAGPAAGHTGVRGAYHLHSTDSDGRCTPEEIAAAAKEAELDYVVLTDHNVMHFALPVYLSGVLVVSAEEVSTPTGHVVALGLQHPLSREERGSNAVAHIVAQGGVAVIAHPFQKKNPWLDWNAARQARGRELYSADSMFRTALAHPFRRFLPAVFSYVGNPTHGLEYVVDAQPEAVTELLAAAADRPTVSFCAHDAHGWPPYLADFRALSMYLPTRRLDPDPNVAARQVVEDLSSGQAWCAFHGLAEGGGFALGGLGPRRTVHPGDVLRVQLPLAAPPETRLWVNGNGRVGEDGRTVIAGPPGSLEVEVWARVPHLYVGDEWKPWLVASPVRVEARAP